VDEQAASIYVVGDRLLVMPMSKTDAGVWVGLDAPAEGSLRNTDEAIGELVRSSIAASDSGRPHPDHPQFKALTGRLLRLAGVRSVAALGRTAALVSVEHREGQYRIMRHVKIIEKGGSRAWFGGTAAERDLSTPSAEQLGAAIRAFAALPEVERASPRVR
jgi:hypothetical protein